jgi:hypothetical protein
MGLSVLPDIPGHSKTEFTSKEVEMSPQRQISASTYWRRRLSDRFCLRAYWWDFVHREGTRITLRHSEPATAGLVPRLGWSDALVGRQLVVVLHDAA